MLPDLLLPVEGWPVDIFNPVNRAHPLNQGRLGWWLALPDYFGGIRVPDLLGMHLGTFTTGAATKWRYAATTRPGGLVDFASDLPSQATGINCGTSPYLQVQAHSWTAWIYFDPGTGVPANTAEILSRAAADISKGYEWGTKDSGSNTFHLSYAYNDGGIRGWYEDTTAMSRGTWYHVGATWNQAAGSVRFFINGVFTHAVATTTGTIGHNATDPFSIGYQGANNSGWSGRLDDVQLWGRVLTDAEIGAVYNLSRVGYPEALNRIVPVSMFAPSAGGGGGGGGGPYTGSAHNIGLGYLGDFNLRNRGNIH